MPPWTDFFPWPRDQYGRGVFIAYRRGGGSETARAIKSELEKRRYRIFLDVDDLGAGPFDESLLAHIEAARYFVVILSKGSLDRCVESDDWLRREITHAFYTRRTIVPVLKEDFAFSASERLPGELSQLPRLNAVLYSHHYFTAVVDKIEEHFKRSQHPNSSTPSDWSPSEHGMPPIALLNGVPRPLRYDEQELKQTAARIESIFKELGVGGRVVQINPGPVVTTFEFKPEAGIKYSKIIGLTEDLCLGLQVESILIERIPGKPTVGIEVPNTRRELIVLRQMLESEEFRNSQSHLTIPLGKDINGRIRVTGLESMPHLLVAGSTGSGKGVMINSTITGILYKAKPDDVRVIMVDSKRVGLGIYEGIPHLLTPVIIDPERATHALRNAVLEMERRLRLLAELGVRNIDQFNRKVRDLGQQPRDSLSEESSAKQHKPLPYILIVIAELADLMILKGKKVEEDVARLAQMARAAGMHLVLATERPSVDVITGLIKANFPTRISFRLASRVDSRTILDAMGAEQLLGKGDMLFLPPGSSRMIRVHGAFVTETEIGRVVDFWKTQASPVYDLSFLSAPPGDEREAGEAEASSDEHDPMYEDAVRLVLQMGKASTATLQSHLRVGYGRAARILDMMQHDGIIGPPDGSKPREVLKPPGWLKELQE